MLCIILGIFERIILIVPNLSFILSPANLKIKGGNSVLLQLAMSEDDPDPSELSQVWLTRFQFYEVANYASPSSGDAYRDRQLTPNFDF